MPIRVQHDLLLEFSGDLAEDVNAFGFETLVMAQSRAGGIGASDLSIVEIADNAISVSLFLWGLILGAQSKNPQPKFRVWRFS